MSGKPQSKGVMFAWFKILVGLFVVTMAYLFFSNIIYNHIRPFVINDIPENSSAYQTIEIIDLMWQYWPLIVIIGFIIYGIVAAQRREPDEYAY